MSISWSQKFSLSMRFLTTNMTSTFYVPYQYITPDLIIMTTTTSLHEFHFVNETRRYTMNHIQAFLRPFCVRNSKIVFVDVRYILQFICHSLIYFTVSSTRLPVTRRIKLARHPACSSRDCKYPIVRRASIRNG